MVLETNTITLDIDKISALIKMHDKDGNENLVILMDGQFLTMANADEIEAVRNAYINLHKSHMYDDKIKKIRWIKGEK